MGRPKKVRELTTSEKFYIDEKRKTETAEKIATDLGLTLELVAPYFVVQPAPVVAAATPVAAGPTELSVAELHYITSLAGKTSPEEIAEALGRSVAEIQVHIPARQNSRMLALMGRQTKRGVENRGITVMTPDASSLSDDTRGSRVKVSGRYVDCIHKPLG